MVYNKDGKSYISVTTLINKMFKFDEENYKKWCMDNNEDPKKIEVLSKSMGTKVSQLMDNHVRGLEFLNPPPIGKYENGLYEGVSRFLKEVEVLETERTVYCDEFGYAGTLDGIVLIDGERYIVDWKTYGAWRGVYNRSSEKIKKVRIQTNMYKYATGEDYKLACVVFKVDGTYEIEKLKLDNTWKDKLKKHPEYLIC